MLKEDPSGNLHSAKKKYGSLGKYALIT